MQPDVELNLTTLHTTSVVILTIQITRLMVWQHFVCLTDIFIIILVDLVVLMTKCNN